ncbi:lysophospholipase [Prauserella marina]|uniref:Lysophospholipase L1 n=1 Tax=Prauserella marina TaxID=530584 RepID=A0A222VJX9_9PSEU|nr:SGNH/GDSL hydrolase family protein [Prauserella marina]ASR34132.1 lysophospholipase [Prauserella marina]PWV82776.1 lysophospholipase L1-like esterase [Prauserella marina]SDC76993.1 Lysophospholipase L1 [Prauserella marina]
MTFARYVALGDSQTEGLGDGNELDGYRGWADRLAERLAGDNPGLGYANLAVRGKLAAEVHAEQLAPALALRPDLATVMAGMNDLIRGGFDAARVVGHIEAMFAELTGAGATVVTVTFPDIGKITPLATPLRSRVLDLNARIIAAAARHDVLVVDTYPHAVTTDDRLWSADRLHVSPLGHARITSAVAKALSLPGDHEDWTRPLPLLPRRTPWQATVTELRWLASFAGPWLYRRVRGRSSGDGRVAKRPELAPVTVSAHGPGGRHPE